MTAGTRTERCQWKFPFLLELRALSRKSSRGRHLNLPAGWGDIGQPRRQAVVTGDQVYRVLRVERGSVRMVIQLNAVPNPIVVQRVNAETHLSPWLSW